MKFSAIDKIVISLAGFVIVGFITIGTYRERPDSVLPFALTLASALSGVAMTIWMFLHAILVRHLERRSMWVLLFVLGTFLTSFVYYFVIYRERHKMPEAPRLS